MIIVFDYMCTRVCLYTMTICTDGLIIDMYLYLLLVAAVVLYYRCFFTYDMDLCGYTVIIVILMSLFMSYNMTTSPSCNIVRCGFCVISWCKHDDPLSLTVCYCH